VRGVVDHAQFNWVLTMAKASFPSEADMIAEFLRNLERLNRGVWTVYPETGDWDLLLVHRDGFQVGLEAKLTLNAKVIEQALDGQHSTYATHGPDYRGVIVPAGGLQHHLEKICAAIGIGICRVRAPESGHYYSSGLPDEGGFANWPNWCPTQRIPIPDYVPDVAAGHPAPVKLTEWKIRAIRLMIILERRGYVTRQDMKAIKISPSRWTDCWHGFLERTSTGYVRCDRTPDLRAQHPVNYAQIEADAEQWAKSMGIELPSAPIAAPQ